MRPIKIITDSSVDLDGELIEKYGIDYVMINHIVDGEIHKCSLTWDAISPKDLDALLNSKKIVKTSQTSMSDFDEKFRKYVDDGFDIFYISISSALSGNANVANMVAKNILKEHPEARIEIYDSRMVSVAMGLLVIYASELVAEGKNLDEISKAVAARSKIVFSICTVHSLDYFKRNGRLKADKAFFGNLMGIRPLITLDDDGHLIPIKKVRGWKQTLDEIAKMVGDSKITESDTFYISHSFAKNDDIEYLKDEIFKRLRCNIHISRMCPIASVICGPESIIVVGYGTNLLHKDGKE